MAIKKFEKFYFNNIIPLPGGMSVSGRFREGLKPAKCIEGKETVWLLTGSARQTQKNTAKKFGNVVIVENVSQEFIDGLQDTINEYESVAPKLGYQCKQAMVFERNRTKLTASFATVDY
jgi:hypothetical protein